MLDTIAVAVAMLIFTGIEALGNNKTTIKRPSAAPCPVPAVIGSTNRLRTSICMIIPQTAKAAPAISVAKVLGKRLSSISPKAAPSWKISLGRSEITPTNKEMAARTKVPAARKSAAECRRI